VTRYVLAFGIFGAGVVSVALALLLPRVRLRRQIHRFRRALADVDHVVLSWRDAMRHCPPSDEVPEPRPDVRRPRRGRRGERDGWAEPLF
jgi:hypothetical protein